MYLMPVPCSFSKGIYHMPSNMPGEEMSGWGLNHMTSNMKGWGSKPHDQQYARTEKVTLGVRALFPQLQPLRGTWGFSPW